MSGLRALQLILGLITTYFLARGLSKEEFGTYYFVLNSVGLISIFSLPGLIDSVAQSISRKHFGTYRKAVPLSFVSSLIGSMILLAMSFWFELTSDSRLWIVLIAAAFLFPFLHGLSLWKGVKTGSENFKSLVLLEGSNTILMTGLLIASIKLWPGSYIAPIIIVMGIPALQNLRMIRKTFVELPKDTTEEAESIKYGVKTTFYSAMNIAAQHLDKILLFTFLSPATLAAYVAADRIAELLRSAVQDISAVLAPRFAKQETYTPQLDKILKYFSFVFGFAIIVFAFTVMPWFLKFVFGHQYENSIPYAQALICSVAIGNLATLRFRYIRSKIDLKNYRSILLATSLSRIFSALIFVPIFGISGAVATAFLYRIVINVVTSRIMKKHYSL